MSKAKSVLSRPSNHTLSAVEGCFGRRPHHGVVKPAQGDAALAQARLREALGLVGAVGAGHLGVRVRTWLAPLVPPDEAAEVLRQGRAVAKAAGYIGLLDEIDRLAPR